MNPGPADDPWGTDPGDPPDENFHAPEGPGHEFEPDLVIGPESEADPDLVECWRCGKRVPPSPRCAICRAGLGAAVTSASVGLRGEAATRRAGRAVAPPLLPDAGEQGAAAMRVILAYAGMLATSIAFGVYRHIAGADPAADPCDFGPILLLEGIDTVLVVAALFWVPRRPRPSPIPARRRLLGWLGGVGLLAVALPVNLGYHRWLVDMLKLPMLDAEIMGACGWTPALLLAFCLQPAIVEELFFRHLVLDSLWASAGVHTAVLVSAVMFGLAHLGNPLGIPVLIVLGLALGYARVLGRSLVLPMILHFAHNALVLALSGG